MPYFPVHSNRIQEILVKETYKNKHEKEKTSSVNNTFKLDVSLRIKHRIDSLCISFNLNGLHVRNLIQKLICVILIHLKKIKKLKLRTIRKIMRL